MAVKFPDILEHNNPLLALVDEDFSRGGRRVVADLTALYALSGQPDQLKELVTIVHVISQGTDYILIDDTNTGNASGWAVYVGYIGAAGSDELIKVSSNDTTAGYLNGKLVAGTGISLTENNDGGNETLTIESLITQYTDEMTQDTIGTISTDSATVNVTYNDGVPSLTWDVIMGSAGYSADDIVQWDGAAFVRRGIESFETWISDWRKNNYDLAKAVNATYRDENKQSVNLVTNVEGLLHSLYYSNGKLWASDMLNPNHFYRFNDPDDLTDYDVLQIGDDSNWDSGYDAIYVKSKDRHYTTSTDNGGTGFSRIYEIDPVTLTKTIILDVDVAYMSFSSLASDETYLYALSADGTIYKIDLSDYSYVTDATLTATFVNAHALRYDGTYLYVTNVTSGARIAQVDPATLTVLQNTLIASGTGFTDDFCFAGDYVWAGRETTTGLIYKIKKSDFTFTTVSTGVAAQCYGTFFDGKYVWALFNTSPGQMVRIDPETHEMYKHTFATGENAVNELCTDGQRLFVSCFLFPISKVIRLTVPELTFVSSLSTSNLFQTIAVATQSNVVADSTTDTLTLVAGTGMGITTNAGTDTITFTNSAPDQTVALTEGGAIDISGTYPNFTIAHEDTSSVSNVDTVTAEVIDTITFDTYGHVTGITLRNLTLSDLGYSAPDIFKTIAVAGQNNVVADSSTDTLTLVAGTGITLATDDTTDTITITNSVTDTHFGNTNLTQTANRTYAGGNFTYTLNNLNDWSLNFINGGSWEINNTHYFAIDINPSASTNTGFIYCDGFSNQFIISGATAGLVSGFYTEEPSTGVLDSGIYTRNNTKGHNIRAEINQITMGATTALDVFGGGTKAFVRVADANIYMNLLVSDNTETNLVAIDTGTGLLSYRSVASLIAGATQNLFETIAVSGQSNVVADSATDTLTLVAGTGITITTDAGTDSITFNTSITQYTDEMAQDAVGNAFINTNTVQSVYDDATPDFSWNVLYQDSATINLSDDASGLKADLIVGAVDNTETNFMMWNGTDIELRTFASLGILAGTVTSFTFTDGNGFDGTVTNATTTPTLSLTTTVANQQVMVSNSGAISGSSGFTWSGTILHVSGSEGTGNGIIQQIYNTDNTASSIAGQRFKVGSGDEGGWFFASKAAISNYGIANGITLRAGTSSQDIGFSVGTNTAGTGAGPDFLIKSTGVVTVNDGQTSYNDFLVKGDTDTNLLSVDVSIDSIGFKTGTPTSHIHFNGSEAHKRTELNVDTTLDINHYYTPIDATAANRIITLPTAAGITGRQYIIKKIDSSANTVTIEAAGTETIDGALNVILYAQWDYIIVISNGTNWEIIG
jgi:hypothetical protein